MERRRFAEDEKGKQKVVDENTPLDIEGSKATHTSMEEECEQRNATGLNTMWLGGLDAEGAMETRTGLILRPSEGPHRPRIDPAQDDRGQLALFRGRQFTALELNQQDLDDMRELRGCSMKVAHISGSRYPPSGYGVQDIATLYAYRPKVSPMLGHSGLGDSSWSSRFRTKQERSMSCSGSTHTCMTRSSSSNLELSQRTE